MLSMYTYYARGKNADEFDCNLKMMSSCGVEAGDVLDVEFRKLPLADYICHLNNAGMTVNAVVSTLDTVTAQGLTRQNNIQAVKTLIDEMSDFNIPYLMVAPEVILTDEPTKLNVMQENFISVLQELCDYAVNKNVTVCIENQSSLRRADSTVNDIKTILEAVPDLGFVLDNGNFFCVGEDALEAFEMLKNRIVYAHIKDWMYDSCGRYNAPDSKPFDGCVIGQGFLPVKELMNNLDCTVSLEMNSPLITTEMLIKSAEYLKECMKNG